MAKQISATDAKNNFGGLLEDVATHGCVEIVKHGRIVALALSPRAFEEITGEASRSVAGPWGETHMIPPERARAARMIRPPHSFDE